MKNSEQVTPVAAAATALSTLLCCVPTGFAAAIATTSAGMFVTDHQAWFLAASVLLIAIGAVQLRRATVCSTATKRTSAMVLALSAVVVIAVIFFPQVLAGLMADWMMLGR
jgi:uncharacterized membrane protein YoaT (DUF817 family)